MSEAAKVGGVGGMHGSGQVNTMKRMVRKEVIVREEGLKFFVGKSLDRGEVTAKPLHTNPTLPPLTSQTHKTHRRSVGTQ